MHSSQRSSSSSSWCWLQVRFVLCTRFAICYRLYLFCLFCLLSIAIMWILSIIHVRGELDCIQYQIYDIAALLWVLLLFRILNDTRTSPSSSLFALRASWERAVIKRLTLYIYTFKVSNAIDAVQSGDFQLFTVNGLSMMSYELGKQWLICA